MPCSLARKGCGTEMAEVETNCEVYRYDEAAQKEGKRLIVRSVLNKGALVEVEIDGKKAVVAGRDLREAVSKCENR